MLDQLKEPTTVGEPPRHILPAASTMIGISTTLIGLVKLFETHDGPSHVDQCAGVAAVLFLFSAVTSHVSVRVEKRTRLTRLLEQIADNLFPIGLVTITGIAVFFAYEMI
ncbi:MULTISPECIES: hypothetical protein [Methylobacterium]|uniref:hypothetical protein n=1 Tax=Methylobacterium TaxID=407 RepID=UPI0013EB32AC|nr:hypothetical protein [Methylobacterium sp. DB0501]NGM33807.1 hypothetical protein [Methylobacterium sp. DB0501]